MRPAIQLAAEQTIANHCSPDERMLKALIDSSRNAPCPQ
jgi:hypothetical protein